MRKLVPDAVHAAMTAGQISRPAREAPRTSNGVNVSSAKMSQPARRIDFKTEMCSRWLLVRDKKMQFASQDSYARYRLPDSLRPDWSDGGGWDPNRSWLPLVGLVTSALVRGCIAHKT